jgi:hypothetical protein
VCGVLAFSAKVSVAEDSTINWSITPYVWAPTTTVDLGFQDTNIGGEIDFKDILDTIDMAFMVHAEGGRGQWSVFADLTYVDASETSERALLSIDVRSKQLMFDTAVAWWPGGIDAPLNVFGGLRYTGFDDRYQFRSVGDGALLASRSSEKDYYDALLGLRYAHDFSDRWSLLGYGDVSFGDSDGTFLLRALLAYSVGKQQQNRFVFGYQYKDMDFKDGELKTELGLSGPVAGFEFRF